jgi:N-acetylneuraminic acid mutarotase
VGGLRIDNAQGEPEQLVSVATVEIFDTQTSSWQRATDLPAPRSSHEAVVIGDELYVVGGWALSGGASSGVFSQELLVADTTEAPLRWRAIEAPVSVRALGVAALGERLVLVGGITRATATRQVHIYDTRTGQWSKGPDFPGQGFGVAAAEFGGAVYASGLDGAVWTLDARATEWQKTERLAFPRVFHRVVNSADKQLLFVGGIPGMTTADRIAHVEALRVGKHALSERITSYLLPAPYPAKNRQGLLLDAQQLYLFAGNNSLGQHDFAPTNFMSQGARLDLSSLQWKPAPSFPVARQSLQTLVGADGKGVALGGFGPAGAALKSHVDLYRYDFEAQEWALAEKGLPEPRTQFGLAEHADKLWVFGGLDFDDQKQGARQFVHPTEVLVLDQKAPNKGFVAAGFELPRPRRAFAGALLDGRYYLVGGMAENFATVDEVDVYDFKAGAFTSIAKPRRTRIGAEAVALGGKLYLIAGRAKDARGEFQADDSIEVYDPATGSWSVLLEKLPIQDTHQLRAFTLREQLVLYSAEREDGQTQIVFIDPND